MLSHFFCTRLFVCFCIIASFCFSFSLSANLTPYILISSKISKKKKIKINLNNIANAHSTGFLSDNGIITSITYKKSQVSMPHVNGSYFNQKKLVQSTGKALDIALLGEGYFKFATDNGIRYSSKGELKILDGFLVDNFNNPILDDQDAPIELDGNVHNIKFARKGEVIIKTNQKSEVIAKLAVVTAANSGLLKKEGNGMLINLGEEIEASNYSVLQGSVNVSNVDVASAYNNTQREISKYKEHDQILSAFLNVYENDTNKLSNIG